MIIDSVIEPLESRIAPAAVVTFTDVDGDLVTVKTSKGTNADLTAILTLAASGLGNALQEIDFSLNGAVFAGTNLSVTAKRTGVGGDGLVNVTYIDASVDGGGSALDLGIVTIRGDLREIDAGDATTATAAVKGLNVQSMGQYSNTMSMGPGIGSSFNGALGYLKVAGNVQAVGLNVSGGVDGKIGSITIGGSLIGGANTSDSGLISSSGAMGPVKIGGNIEGGFVTSGAGRIFCGGTMASLTVGGSILGGSRDLTGYVAVAGALGPVKIGGDVKGGGQNSSGAINAASTIASVTVGGSLVGGAGAISGAIFSDRAIGAVKIGGSIIAGTVAGSGAIQAGDSIGPITVKGSLIGESPVPVLITARGEAIPRAGADVAIKSLTVGGRVEFADILAGYDTAGVGVNADAQIGPVVAGDWIASNLVAGVQDDADAARDDFFGEGDDQKIAGGSAGTVSKIASILIKGTALGTFGGMDHFGFLAQQIGSFKIGKTAFPLTPGAANDLTGLPVGITGNLRVREVAL